MAACGTLDRGARQALVAAALTAEIWFVEVRFLAPHVLSSFASLRTTAWRPLPPGAVYTHQHIRVARYQLDQRRGLACHMPIEVVDALGSARSGADEP